MRSQRAFSWQGWHTPQEQPGDRDRVDPGGRTVLGHRTETGTPRSLAKTAGDSRITFSPFYVRHADSMNKERSPPGLCAAMPAMLRFFKPWMAKSRRSLAPDF